MHPSYRDGPRFVRRSEAHRGARVRPHQRRPRLRQVLAPRPGQNRAKMTPERLDLSCCQYRICQQKSRIWRDAASSGGHGSRTRNRQSRHLISNQTPHHSDTLRRDVRLFNTGYASPASPPLRCSGSLACGVHRWTWSLDASVRRHVDGDQPPADVTNTMNFAAGLRLDATVRVGAAVLDCGRPCVRLCVARRAAVVGTRGARPSNLCIGS